MKQLHLSFGWLAILFCLAIECHSQVESREFWQHNNRYLVCKDGPENYFALEMATCHQLSKPEAKRMWDSAGIAPGPLNSIPIAYFLDTFNVQKNTWCAWNNCAMGPVSYSPRVKVLPVKNKQPGTVYAGTIPGFDNLLKREQELVKNWKKQDKKRSIQRWYYDPVIRHDTTNRRVFLVGYAGIAWVSEDSLANGARQVLGEIPGLRLRGVASPQYHRYIFLLYVQQDVKDVWHDEKTICRVFDTHTMQLLKLPESDYMTDPRFVFCPSGDYVFAVHTRVVLPWQTFSPCVINLRDWRVETKLQLRGVIEDMRFYLHRNLLYLNSTWHIGESSVWVLDFSKGEKEIFRYNLKR